MKNRVKKKKEPLKITFHHIKPKNEEEAKEQIRKLEEAFNILFKAVLEEREKEMGSK